MKMAPLRGTQVAVVLPANGVPKGDNRLRAGLTIDSFRALTSVQRCYKCHMLGHVAAKCTAVCSGKELRRRCGSAEHFMKDCDREPRYAICSRQEGWNARLITGSLSCPMERLGGRGVRRGLN
jgi:hypothetical protein